MPLPAVAWWETGHRIIARIAAAHLTPVARARVARLLDVADTPDAVADALARASTWADETRKETRTGSWHYINLTIQDSRSDFGLRCKDDNCAPARLREFVSQLRSQAAAYRSSDLDALRYVIHLAGDIHQPLHTISNADLGGNCERLEPPVGEAADLHALWDSGLLYRFHRNDRWLAAALERQIESMDAGEARRLAEGTVDDWTWETHNLAIRAVYAPLHIPVQPVEFPASCAEAPPAITGLQLDISRMYLNGMKPLVRGQLIKAGLRLAKLLNQSFAP